MKVRLFFSFVVLTLFSIYTSRSHAEESATSISAGVPAATETSRLGLPITKGKWQMGGGFNSWRSDSGSWSLNVVPNAEYFVIDRLSLGLDVNVWVSSFQDYATISLNPAATYHFATTEKWSFFARQTLGGYFTTGLGATYFINEHAGFSPQLRVSYGSDRIAYGEGIGTFNVYF